MKFNRIYGNIAKPLRTVCMKQNLNIEPENEKKVPSKRETKRSEIMRALPLLESTRVLLSVVVLFDVRKAVPCAQGGMFL